VGYIASIIFIVIFAVLGITRSFAFLYDKRIKAWQIIIYLVITFLNIWALYMLIVPDIA